MSNVEIELTSEGAIPVLTLARIMGLDTEPPAQSSLTNEDHQILINSYFMDLWKQIYSKLICIDDDKVTNNEMMTNNTHNYQPLDSNFNELSARRELSSLTLEPTPISVHQASTFFPHTSKIRSESIKKHNMNNLKIQPMFKTGIKSKCDYKYILNSKHDEEKSRSCVIELHVIDSLNELKQTQSLSGRKVSAVAKQINNSYSPLAQFKSVHSIKDIENIIHKLATQNKVCLNLNKERFAICIPNEMSPPKLHFKREALNDIIKDMSHLLANVTSFDGACKVLVNSYSKWSSFDKQTKQDYAEAAVYEMLKCGLIT
jgi:hypothetical protein